MVSGDQTDVTAALNQPSATPFVATNPHDDTVTPKSGRRNGANQSQALAPDTSMTTTNGHARDRSPIMNQLLKIE